MQPIGETRLQRSTPVGVDQCMEHFLSFNMVRPSLVPQLLLNAGATYLMFRIFSSLDEVLRERSLASPLSEQMSCARGSKLICLAVIDVSSFMTLRTGQRGKLHTSSMKQPV